MKRLLVCLYLTAAHDRFAVLACDGLYDVMSNNGIVSFISEEAEKPDATLDQISQVRSVHILFYLFHFHAHCDSTIHSCDCFL